MTTSPPSATPPAAEPQASGLWGGLLLATPGLIERRRERLRRDRQVSNLDVAARLGDLRSPEWLGQETGHSKKEG